MQEKDCTPAMKQYYEMKESYKDCILFFRMGDFYEMFDEDAQIAHKVLGVALTTRNKNAIKPTPLAGIPYHAKEKYLPILVEAGYKVAIAEQVSDPKLKWIVKREVVRVVTPSTLHLEWDVYEKNLVSSYMVSLVEEKGKYGVSFLDLGDNSWFSWEFDTFEKMAWEVYKIAPKEVILEKKLFEENDIRELFTKKFNLNIYYFQTKLEAKKKLREHFWVKNLEGYGLEGKSLAIEASWLLLEYLEENQKSSVDFLSQIRFESFSSFLELDESTLKNLDIIYNFATKSKNQATLFWVMHKTKTSMGTRFLQQALIKPEKDKQEIIKRQDFIKEFYNNSILLDKVQNKMKYIADIDALLTRLVLARAGTRDMLHLKKSLQMILEIYTLIQEEGSEKLKKIIL